MEERECREHELASEEESEGGGGGGENESRNGGLGEDELELSLGLPVSSSRQALTDQNNKNYSVDKPAGFPETSCDSNPLSRSPTPTVENVCFGSSPGGLQFLDPRTRREVQAMRRQEARKKREEKRKSRGNHGSGIWYCNGNWHGNVNVSDHKFWWEKQRAEEREIRERESEADFPERHRKGSNNNDNSNNDDNNNNLVAEVKVGVETASFLARPAGSFHQQVSGKGGGGSGLRFLVPGLDGSGTSEKNGFRPVGGGAGGGFRPYLAAGTNSASASGIGGGRDGDTVKGPVLNCSRGSSNCFSLRVSDHQSLSGQGGCSSDGGSHSNSTRSQSDHHPISIGASPPSHGAQVHTTSCPHSMETSHPSVIPPPPISVSSSKSELSSSSSHDKETIKPHALSKATPNPVGGATIPTSSTTNSSSNGPVLEAHRVSAGPGMNMISSTRTRSLSPGSKESSKGSKKLLLPPKPPPPPHQQAHKQETSFNGETLLLSQMPCVSTTGNGPNGKTITGFLYRYTKSEVRIVCVCHGNSFSPSEFVEHAGGVDIEHPLRHITVVPFTLG